MESSEQRNDEILGNEEELTTIQQVEVPFLDARILALLGSDEDIYIPIIAFSENVLGLYSGTRQVTRIKKDDALASALKKMPIETPGGLQATQCLRLDMFTVWLLSIQEKSCKESIRPTLTQYKREAGRVILAHFRQKSLIKVTSQLPAPMPAVPAIPEPGAPPTDFATYYRALAAVYDHIAEQQAIITQHSNQLAQHETDIISLADDMQGVKETIAILGELVLETRISPQQASEIQQLVGKIHETKKVHQKTIYAQFNKHWQIPRYDELPASKFDAAIAWLKRWGGV